MKATCNESKNFELFENAKRLGRLTYKNWFSSSAEIEVDKMMGYEIKPKDLLGVAFTLSKDKEEMAVLRMNLKGEIELAFKEDQNYIFKRKSFLNSKYIIEHTNGQELIRFMPSFDWKKLKYSYDIGYEEKPDILLVLTGMYCANYYIALSGGAVTATI